MKKETVIVLGFLVFLVLALLTQGCALRKKPTPRYEYRAVLFATQSVGKNAGFCKKSGTQLIMGNPNSHRPNPMTGEVSPYGTVGKILDINKLPDSAPPFTVTHAGGHECSFEDATDEERLSAWVGVKWWGFRPDYPFKYELFDGQVQEHTIPEGLEGYCGGILIAEDPGFVPTQAVIDLCRERKP